MRPEIHRFVEDLCHTIDIILMSWDATGHSQKRSNTRTCDQYFLLERQPFVIAARAWSGSQSSIAEIEVRRRAQVSHPSPDPSDHPWLSGRCFPSFRLGDLRLSSSGINSAGPLDAPSLATWSTSSKRRCRYFAATQSIAPTIEGPSERGRSGRLPRSPASGPWRRALDGAVASLVMAGLLVVVVVTQLRTRHYTPWIYWLTVVLVSVVGTEITDLLTDGLGVSLYVSTSVFALALAATFIVWY